VADNVTFRPARRDDCAEIAGLFRIASEGIADYVWSQVQEPGVSLLETGERRYRRENTAFSYQNCVIAERDGAILGMLHGFAMEADSEPPADEPDPVLRPYSELEAPGSYYIAGVALYPEHRGRGIGDRMLALARDRARELDLESLSLIVFEQNQGALRLYERSGYREIDRRTVVPHPLIHATGDAILMLRPAA
jgi:ribosomal protein S18 acetylase RimI-like enzyme